MKMADGMTARQIIHALLDTTDDMLDTYVEVRIFGDDKLDKLLHKGKVVSVNKSVDGSLEVEINHKYEEEEEEEEYCYED